MADNNAQDNSRNEVEIDLDELESIQEIYRENYIKIRSKIVILHIFGLFSIKYTVKQAREAYKRVGRTILLYFCRISGQTEQFLPESPIFQKTRSEHYF